MKTIGLQTAFTWIRPKAWLQNEKYFVVPHGANAPLRVTWNHVCASVCVSMHPSQKGLLCVCLAQPKPVIIFAHTWCQSIAQLL